MVISGNKLDNPSSNNSILPVMIIGISGATWSLIEPLIKKNKLPNFSKLRKMGTYGVLKSVKVRNDKHYRPQTAWPSFFTGLYPERHGITKFYHTLEDLTAKSIWDFFTSEKLGVGIFGLPMVWPVPPLHNGFVVPSSYARNDLTFPSDLSYLRSFHRFQQNKKQNPAIFASIKKILKILPLFFYYRRNIMLFIYLIFLAINFLFVKNKEMKNLIIRKIKLIYETAIFISLHMLFKPHLSIYTNFVIDIVSHRFWRYYEPDKFEVNSMNPVQKFGNALESTYQLMDKCLGHILNVVSNKCNVVLLSEHGMAAESKSNELGKYQYLINGIKIKKYANLDDDILLIPLARWLALRRKNSGKISKRLIQQLENIIVVDTGLPLFQIHTHGQNEVVIKLNFKREEYANFEDDLEKLKVHFHNGKTVAFQDLSYKVGPSRSAMHHEDGIFIMRGPKIKENHCNVSAQIVDILPTVLQASGFKVPKDIDGKVLDIFLVE